MRIGQIIIPFFCLVLFLPGFMFSQGYYKYKLSPLAGVGYSQSVAPELGIATEIFRGSEHWQSSPDGGGHTVRKYNALGQSLGAEFYFVNNDGNMIIPKYTAWFHSYAFSVFTFGVSALYSKKDWIYLRPEAGVILPADKMNSLFGWNYLRLRIMYGYNFFLMIDSPSMQHSLSLIFYFGNSSGQYRAVKSYTNELQK